MPNEMTPLEAAYRIEEHNRVHSKKEPQAILITEALKIAVSALRRVAAGELMPVIHAHWNRINRMATGLKDEFRCSKCGWAVKEATKHCPNCAAQMDESDMRQTQGGKDDSHASQN